MPVLRPPYLIFLGDVSQPTYAKTGQGLVDWRGEHCIGQLRLCSDTVDLGLPDLDISAALQANARSVVIGTAVIGGQLPDSWLGPLCEAASQGLDIVAGLHGRLTDIPVLVQAAERGGSHLVDVRVPPVSIPVGSGQRRSGRRLLTVGTDCAVGKKYTALQLERDMKTQGMRATFRASGQTGILIAGAGIPIDAVISDFIVGAAEQLSPANASDHWDVIEGQGSLFHPAYAPVSLGLLQGSQPDAFVVCHEAGRERVQGWAEWALPSPEALIERTITLGSLINSDIRCVGISVNTSVLAACEREDYLAELAVRTGMPCVDPLLDGTHAIVEQLV